MEVFLAKTIEILQEDYQEHPDANITIIIYKINNAKMSPTKVVKILQLLPKAFIMKNFYYYLKNHKAESIIAKIVEVHSKDPKTFIMNNLRHYLKKYSVEIFVANVEEILHENQTTFIRNNIYYYL